MKLPPEQTVSETTIETKPITIQADERVAIIGATGSGKTVLAKYLLSNSARAVVIDPKHTFVLQDFRVSNTRPMFLGKKYHIIYRPVVDDDDKLSGVLHTYWKSGDTIIYIDELSTMVDGYPKSIQVLSEIARTGRERRVGLWVTMQRPRWVPRLFLTESEHMMIFSLRSGEDRTYVAGFAGDEVKRTNDKFNFWYVSPEYDRPVLLHYNLERDRIQEVSNG